MDRNSNLLFGIFAAQLKKVAPAQIEKAAAAWATDQTVDISDRLVDMGALLKSDSELIGRLVNEAVGAHHGDAAATLARFGGGERVAESFHGTIVLTRSGDVAPPTVPLPPEERAKLESIPGVQETPHRYTRQTEHARGGMGRVLLVHDEHLGRDIALKELLPKLSVSDAESTAPTPFMARFLQEARITGQLEHPSIVPVYELGRRMDGTLYYTMKLVRGRTLAAAIAESANIEERLGLLPHFVDLCQAMAYAHSRKVIHRDIKPGNVMVGEFGETVVLDWGLAKAIGKDDAHADGFSESLRVLNLGDQPPQFDTRHGQAMGTPVYMPPEQAQGHIDQIDERSDVYSLGAVLYQLLTGEAPFEGPDLHSILQRVVHEAPRPVATFESKAPPELVAIALHALQKDPQERYQSARELAEEVQRFQSGSLVQAYQYTPREVMGRFVRKHRKVLSAVAAALFLLIAISSFYTYHVVQVNQDLEDALTSTVIAQQRETTARKSAEAAQHELEQVVQFQTSQLSDIDAALMGVSLRNALVEKRRAALAAAGMDETEINLALAQLDETLAGVNFTDIALQLLDENIFEGALEAIERDFAEQPLVKARLLQTTALTLRTVGLLERATAPQVEALAIRRRELGNEHPVTLDSIGLMGGLLNAQGKREEAEPYYREALETKQRVLGDDDIGTLAAFNNMGFLLRTEGKRIEAEPYIRKALEGRRRILGDTHPLTLNSMSNLGFLLHQLGRLDEAEPYYREALEGLQRAAGDTHPDTLNALSNLGRLLQTRGRPDEAEPYLSKALAGLRRERGDTHPHTLTALQDMGLLLQAQGKFDEAEEYCRKALEGRRNVLGETHPLTLNSLSKLGALLLEQDKLDEAESCFREALEKERMELGDDHPFTLDSINSMGALREEQEKLGEAELCYSEAYEARRRVLGSEHPDTLTSLQSLTKLLAAMQRYEEAEPLALEYERLTRSRHGDGHAKTYEAVTLLVQLYDGWHTAEPGADHETHAAEWRAKLPG